MPVGRLAIVLVACGVQACAGASAARQQRQAPPQPPVSPAPLPTPTPGVDFARDIGPVLGRCQPCHFPGGVVYEQMPFDRAETVHRLGTRLFSRIKDEQQQQLIREFLSQGPTADAASAGAPPR
jgi:hypothetical protein